MDIKHFRSHRCPPKNLKARYAHAATRPGATRLRLALPNLGATTRGRVCDGVCLSEIRLIHVKSDTVQSQASDFVYRRGKTYQDRHRAELLCDRCDIGAAGQSQQSLHA